jgi:hypothetical protein
MEIEYLSSGSPECPLIRIYGTDQENHKHLFDAVCSLADGTEEITSTDSIFGTGNPINLTLSSKPSDETVEMINESSGTWTLSCNGWHKVSKLLRPFASRPKHGTYQWLGGGTVGNVSILVSFSSDGRW